MDNLGHSYESLSSEQALRDRYSGANPWPPTYTRWSRIQNSLSRSVPQTPLAVWDQPLDRHDAIKPPAVGNASLAPHDQFLSEIPTLPFPLISLPEAAMIQHYRRERGEEDHTQTAVSFSAKSRSCTVSSIASSQPTWTPMSPDFGRQSAHSAFVLKPPALVYRGSGGSENRTWKKIKDGDMALPLPSANTYGTPSPKTVLNFSRKSLYRGGPYDSWTILGNSPIRPQVITPQLQVRNGGASRATYRDGHMNWRAPSRLDHVESARGNTIYHRPGIKEARRRQKIIFFAATLFTVIFPPAGYPAISGKLDSTISWCTHGELHCLTEEQRGTLKQQLLVEAVLYPLLIICLGVIYAARG